MSARIQGPAGTTATDHIKELIVKKIGEQDENTNDDNKKNQSIERFENLNAKF